MALFKKKQKNQETYSYDQEEYYDDLDHQQNEYNDHQIIDADNLENDEILFDTNLTESINRTSDMLEEGSFSWLDIISPESIYRGDIEDGDWILIGGKFARPFYISGYPNTVMITWLTNLYDAKKYDLDVTVHVLPLDTVDALRELNSQISKVLSELISEEERQSHLNITRLIAQRDELVQNRKQLERNVENSFHVQICGVLYADSLKELNREYDQIVTKMSSKRVAIDTPTLQQEEGYLSGLPLGKTYLPKKVRNFNSSALAACFPFYHSDIIQEDGVLLGTNMQTHQPVLMNFYDDNFYTNPNITIIGMSGSGKTYTLSLIIIRSVFLGIRTAIVDPEAEFSGLTKMLGGIVIRISNYSNQMLNPFEISEEYNSDLDRKIVDLNEKNSDLLSLFDVMVDNMWDNAIRSECSDILKSLYVSDFGITDDPNSLIEPESNFDEENQNYSEHGRMKTMPTMSDYVNKLFKVAEEQGNEDLKKIATALRIYTKSGVYGMFDGVSSTSLDKIESSCLISFDVSKLEGDKLRPIGMFISLSWIWEKFGKKNIGIRKRIICDEAWMLVSSSFSGTEYTAGFLDVMSRRIRKNTGGLVVASQKLLEFVGSNAGLAVLTNSATKMFLRQDKQELSALISTFGLSDKEAGFLVKSSRGQVLIQTQKFDSVVCDIKPFNYEAELIELSKAEMARTRQS